jgi:hypothetical protein
MTADREQRIRDRAHQIWQDEGCPEGRADEHWAQAEREVAEAAPAPKPDKAPAVKKAPAAKAPAAKKPAAKSAAKTAGDAVAAPKRASKAKTSA